MVEVVELQQRAKELPRDARSNVLKAFTETELHTHLKELFQRMGQDYTVAITHGNAEYGKDLVMVKRDSITIDVIAVVVKKGDIRGTTAGDVDELADRVGKALSGGEARLLEQIQSAVTQSFDIDAELPSFFARLPVNKILVVLAGSMSHQARKRLEADPRGRSITTHDIEWLTDNFTSFYPQVFFEAKAFDFVHDKIHEFESNHRLSESGKTLSEYFVEPAVTTLDSPITLAGSMEIVLRERRLPFLELRKVIEGQRCVLLVGGPGTGKSAALAKMAVDMLQDSYRQITREQANQEKIPVPVIVSAAQIADSPTVDSLLDNYFGSADTKARFFPKVIMIDALDAVPRSRQKEVIGKAESFCSQLGCALIVASRRVESITAFPASFSKYEIQPLETGQALSLFKKIVGGRQTLVALQDGLARIRNKIPMAPLSLILLIKLVEEHKEVPASITELYERFLDMALGRYDRDKGISVLFEYAVKKRFLASFAYHELMQKNRLHATQSELGGFTDAYAKHYGWSVSELTTFKDELDRAGILDIREDGVSFRHRSFLDYFAALHIHDARSEVENLDDLLVNTYFNDVWTNVVFFYVGMRREISESLVAGIAAFPAEGPEASVGKFMSASLLQAGWDSSFDTKLLGIRNAISEVPRIRAHFLMETANDKAPPILADFYVFVLSELALSSTFLFKASIKVLDEISHENDLDSAYKMLPLISSVRRFLNPEQLKTCVALYEDTLSRIPNLALEDRVRQLILLRFLEQGDKPALKALKSRLLKLRKRYPAVFKRLLPKAQKGFRHRRRGN
jgi:hypothetical protein